MPVDAPVERFEQAIEIRPEDIDFFGHVNNVVYLRWVQTRDQKVLARARSLGCPVDLHTRRLMRVPDDVFERVSVSRIPPPQR